MRSRGARTAVSGTNASTVARRPAHGGPARVLDRVASEELRRLAREEDRPEITGTIGFLDGQAKVAYDIAPRHSLQLLVLSGSACTAMSPPIQPTRLRGRLDEHARVLRLAVRQRSRARRNGSRSWPIAFGTRARSFRNRRTAQRRPASGEATSTMPVGDWTIAGGASAERQATATVFRNFQTSGHGDACAPNDRLTIGARLPAGWMSIGGRPMNTGVTGGVRLSHDTFSRTSHASPWVLVEKDVAAVRLSFAASRAVQYNTRSRTSRPRRPVASSRPGSSTPASRRACEDARVVSDGLPSS